MVVANAFLRWLAPAVVALGVALVLTRLSPSWARPLAGIVWIAAVAFFGVRQARTVARVRWSHQHVAGRVEDTYPATRSRLLSALELDAQRERNDRLGYDTYLVDRAVSEGARCLAGVQTRVVFATERRQAIRALLYALTACVGLFALVALRVVTSATVREWTRSPVAAYRVSIEWVKPGNAAVERGADVPIRALIRGSVGRDARLEYRDSGASAWGTVPMTVADGSYSATLRNVVSPLEYRVRAKSAVSESYTLSVANPPGLESLTVTLRFPTYSGLAPKTLERDQGDVRALVGTTVEMTGRSSQPLSRATVDFDEREDIALDVNAASFRGSFVVRESGRYALALTNASAVAQANPPRFFVEAIPDEKPAVEVTRPGRDAALDQTMRVPLTVEATDDYGISRLLLHYTNEKREQSGVLPLRSFPRATPLARVDYEWDLKRLDLFPDESVAYYVEAFDNDTVSGPKRAVSPTYRLRFPSMTELFDELIASQEVQSQTMDSIVEAQGEAEDIVDSLIDRLRKEQELTLNEKKELERAVQMEQKIEEKREELSQEIAKSLDQARKSDLMDAETLQRVEEMQRLLDEVASDALKEAMRKLQQALRETKLDAQREQLMAANFKQEEFRQRIEQMIQMLEKMKSAQEVQKALKLAEALVEQQGQVVEKTEALNRELGERRPTSDSPEGRRSSELGTLESRVRTDAKELTKHIETASRQLRSDDALQQVADELDRLRNEAVQNGLDSNLNRAQNQLSSRNPQNAQPPATDALRQLQQLRQGLDNVNEFMQGSGGEAVMAALREAIRDTLHLAQEHQSTFDATRELSANRSGSGNNPLRRQLASRENALADGADAITDRFRELSEEDIQIPLELAWGLRDAADALRRSSQALEENELGRAVPIQRDALAQLNTTALKMLAAMDNMNAQASSAGMQNMMQQMERLAEGQGDLNRLAEQIERQLRQQGTSPSDRQTLERMAFEQGLIRQAMERLAQKMQNAKQALGDVRDLPKEMGQVERELGGSRLNRDVLERMRRIETRMLESTKALQQRETGKTRKSETGQRLFGEQSGEENAEWERIRQQFTGELGNLSDVDAPEAYRALIRSYFRALTERKPSR
jgi:hypothetical protein